jgi:hypothetical protein
LRQAQRERINGSLLQDTTAVLRRSIAVQGELQVIVKDRG